MKELLENFTGQKASVKTLFSYEFKGNKVVFYFEAYNSSLESYSNIDNDKLYDGNVVELFLDIGEENKYLEIEVAPNGAKFVASICNREITFVDPSFIKTKSVIKDDAYFVEMIIDLDKLGNPSNMMFNAFRIEDKENEKRTLCALSPTYCGTFHVREKFIPLK